MASHAPIVKVMITALFLSLFIRPVFSQTMAADAKPLPGYLQAAVMDDLPNVGEYLPAHMRGLPDTPRVLIMATPSQMWDCYPVFVDSIRYELGVTDSGHVRYIATYDSSFVTHDSLTLSSTVVDALEQAAGEMYHLPGWGYVLPLRSGWNAAWCVGYTCTDSLPSSDQPIGWFFKGGN